MGEGSFFHLTQYFSDKSLEKLCGVMQMGGIAPSNKQSLQRPIANMIRTSYDHTHPIVNGFGTKFNAHGKMQSLKSHSSSNKTLNETNCNPTGLKLVFDLDYEFQLNVGQLQFELETHRCEKHVGRADTLATAMCKYVPTKNLQLPLKLALTRLPSDELNCLWGEIRALISNKECAKIRTQVYLVLLKSGLPVFDCTVFRSSIIPRIFCALVLEELKYDITVKDFTDTQDEDDNGFDFKKNHRKVQQNVWARHQDIL